MVTGSTRSTTTSAPAPAPVHYGQVSLAPPSHRAIIHDHDGEVQVIPWSSDLRWASLREAEFAPDFTFTGPGRNRVVFELWQKNDRWLARNIDHGRPPAESGANTAPAGQPGHPAPSGNNHKRPAWDNPTEHQLRVEAAGRLLREWARNNGRELEIGAALPRRRPRIAPRG